MGEDQREQADVEVDIFLGSITTLTKRDLQQVAVLSPDTITVDIPSIDQHQNRHSSCAGIARSSGDQDWDRKAFSHHPGTAASLDKLLRHFIPAHIVCRSTKMVDELGLFAAERDLLHPHLVLQPPVFQGGVNSIRAVDLISSTVAQFSELTFSLIVPTAQRRTLASCAFALGGGVHVGRGLDTTGSINQPTSSKQVASMVEVIRALGLQVARPRPRALRSGWR